MQVKYSTYFKDTLKLIMREQRALLIHVPTFLVTGFLPCWLSPSLKALVFGNLSRFWLVVLLCWPVSRTSPIRSSSYSSLIYLNFHGVRVCEHVRDFLFIRNGLTLWAKQRNTLLFTSVWVMAYTCRITFVADKAGLSSPDSLLVEKYNTTNQPYYHSASFITKTRVWPPYKIWNQTLSLLLSGLIMLGTDWKAERSDYFWDLN